MLMPSLSKHGYQADQRQPDQAGGVIALGALKQAHPEAFCFEAASAVVGLLGMQVAFDLLRGERAHVHGKRYAVGLVLPVWLLSRVRPVRKLTLAPLASSSCWRALSKV
jgi:hypothetical protein